MNLTRDKCQSQAVAVLGTAGVGAKIICGVLFENLKTSHTGTSREPFAWRVYG